MLDVLSWPSGLAPKAVTQRLLGMATVGPPTLTNRSRASATDAGYWQLTLEGIPVAGSAKIQAWRAFIASMEGGARAAYVPAWDYDQAPWANAGGYAGNVLADSKFSDNTVFDDGTGFYSPAILVSLSADAALRDTTISVTVTTAGTIRAGMMFSMLSERLHTIREVLSATSWSIWPPLRRAYTSGTDLEFEHPMVKAVLSSPDQGAAALNYGRYGSASVTFREAI